MSENVRTKTLWVGGMTCVSCERRIERKLKGTLGVLDAKANFSKGTVHITCDADAIDLGTVEKLIEELDYRVVRGDPRGKPDFDILTLLWVSVALYELYALFDRFQLFDVFYNFPEAEAGMGYGMLFVVGLLTSVHCLAMCGGINLSQSLGGKPLFGKPLFDKPRRSALSSMPRALVEYLGENAAARLAVVRSGFLYNAGRVVSYTFVGGLVGLLGAVVSPSENLRGFIQLAAGAFMALMGLNMLNLLPWLRRFTPHMPSSLGDKIHNGKNNGPLFVGLLNGFMPCGPLQAMQLYALSTGSLLKGALSMFVFSAGTLPLMFGLSALSSILGKKFTRGMMMAGAVMVIVLGVGMFGNGMSLTGFSEGFEFASSGVVSVTAQAKPAQTERGVVQLVRTELKSGRYDPIKVQAGVLVRWTIHAEPGTINGCNNKIVIPEYGRLQKKLVLGDNIVEFTPTRTGTFTYTCWMGMIRGKITVVEGDAGNPTVAAAALPPISAGNTAEAAEPEENYDSDPFAELFGVATSQDVKPQSSITPPNSKKEFFAGRPICPCCAP
ncbi:MAG: sulfite exporter TauE/SafE family protein [Synergistaceae bacterium]|jgi:sulfite exporter TauE/SafE/copper chaperone CopZ|nr:sulfite exporter TauE/SafE family protein [Synergistaceae bacterium]